MISKKLENYYKNREKKFYNNQNIYNQGYLEGREYEEKEIIMRMFKNKEPIENISKYLYIPQDIIREIINCYEKSENSN